MGWQQSVFPLLIVTSAPGSFSGQFNYSPAPGPGNLTGSNTAGSGVDPFGNAYVAGLITYTTIGGVSVAQGSQAGRAYFATAPGPGGPYTPASGSLRAIVGPLPNGFSEGTDVNGTADPAALAQVDAGTINMAGRIVTPSSGPVLLTTFATIGAPFLLPAAAAPVPEFPTVNAGGGQAGAVILRPNGNMQLIGNFTTSTTILTSGTFHF